MSSSGDYVASATVVHNREVQPKHWRHFWDFIFFLPLLHILAIFKDNVQIVMVEGRQPLVFHNVFVFFNFTVL